MHLVALTEVARSAPDLRAIASVVGTDAYDLRLVLNAGLPAVVLVTDDGARATAAAAALQALGHSVATCQRSAVTPSAQMTAVRVVDVAGGGIARAEGQLERLPCDDVLCLLRATHETTTETVEKIKERKLRPGMALATGGMVMTRKTEREVRSSRSERQQVLYLFRRSGALPWILREREINYAGLGGELAPSAFQNFTRTLALVQSCCPDATYDESLLRPRPIRGISAGVEAVDVYAHLFAEHVRQRG